MTTQRQAERAMDTHADALAAYPNVVGVGMIDSDSDDRPGADRAHAVAVYVTKKKPTTELDADELLPGFVEIDERGETLKVPVKVVEIGEIGPQNGLADRWADGSENRGNGDDDGSTFFPQ
jgi:hypothetical protein